MQITCFGSLSQARGWKKDVDDVEFFEQPLVAKDKKSLPLFSFAVFDEDYRDSKHFKSIDILGFDVDEVAVTKQQIEAAIASIGCVGIFHTSPSDKDSTRWRLFIPLDKPVDLKQYKTLHAAIRARLPFKVGLAAQDATRAWFVPARIHNYEWGHIDGKLLESSMESASSEPRPLQVVRVGGHRVLDEPAHAEFIAALIAAWPPVGKRQDAHLALAGVLARMGYSVDYAVRVARELTLATGNDESQAQKRERVVRRTYARLVSDEGVSSFRALEAILGTRSVEVLDHVREKSSIGSGTSPAGLVQPLTDWPEQDPQHVYSYEPGKVAAAYDQKKGTDSSITSYLLEHPDWANQVLRWDLIADRLVAVNPPMRLLAEQRKYDAVDDFAVKQWLESNGVAAPVEQCGRCLQMAARSRPWNPFVEYLKKCNQEEGAIDRLCTESLHISEDDVLSRRMLRRQMIAACKRAMDPLGQRETTWRKCDSVVVFVGSQGKFKTWFIQALFGAQYVKTNLADIHHKDSTQELEGMLAVEFGELASVSNNNVEMLKEFLSRDSDVIRKSFGRKSGRWFRTCVFFGTTNNPEFLRDETGNRRFWIIFLENHIDIQACERLRDAAWGEAYAAALKHEKHWFDKEEQFLSEAIAENYMIHDPWEDVIRSYLIGKRWVRIVDIWTSAMGNSDISRLDMGINKRLGRILHKLGCRNHPHQGLRKWRVPDEHFIRVSEASSEGMNRAPVEQTGSASFDASDTRTPAQKLRG